ncbi:MAG: zinc-dependent metalloprotease, partial [Chloroflexi bacterium]|nr:zinc-dependent metalloprotease [Chloroflexota bacterium]
MTAGSARIGAQGRSATSRALSSGAVRVGVAIGAGLAARYLAGQARRVGREGLVDWHRVERIATTRLRRLPGTLSRAELERSAPAYAAAMARIVPVLEKRLGTPLPGVVERHAVVDRAGWAKANLVTFEHLVARLERQLLPQVGSGVGAGVAAMANRFVTTQQIGFLLGYLGGRVLGQYDVALLSAEQAPGRLLFVEENVRATAAQLDVPLDEFRTWIALHETTHAFEMEAHPWLRPYLKERLERQLALFLDEARSLQTNGVRPLLARWRSAAAEGDLSGFLSPEQRGLLRETQLVMSLLEGFSDWVMDEVGAEMMTDVAGIRQRFDARRNQRRRGLERVIARLTGLDLKMEQYRRGERFVAG